MTLAQYFYKRFFFNVLLINLSLTFVFNLVEFFEKMVRVKNIDTTSILYFIALNIAPSFFENFPIGTWIASVLMIKEMQQHNEWETLQILSIRFSNIFRLFFIAGSGLVFISFLGTEIITSHVKKTAETFKQEQLKQTNKLKIYNQWFALSDKQYCHCNVIDLETNKGEGLILLDLSPNNTLHQVTTAKTFLINPKERTIRIDQGARCLAEQKDQKTISNQTISLPQFFTNLQLKTNEQSLPHLLSILLLNKSLLTQHPYNQLLYTTINRLLRNLLLLLYPLLTFLLFCLMSSYATSYKLIAMLIPYPLFVLLSTVSDSIMKITSNGLVGFLPYVIIILLIFSLYSVIRRK